MQIVKTQQIVKLMGHLSITMNMGLPYPKYYDLWSPLILALYVLNTI